MKQDFRQSGLLVGVWREACKHSDLSTSVTTVAALLRSQFPLQGLSIVRWESGSSDCEVVAAGTAGLPGAAGPARRQLSATTLKRLETWCKEGRCVRSRRDELPTFLRPLTSDYEGGDIFIGPLWVGGDRAGLVVATAPAGHHYSQDETEFLVELLEPLSVALEEDRRRSELVMLRAAAEADRRALLAKLGRSDVAAPIVGADAGLREVTERVRVVASSDVPVLLLGETGSGKEVIARAIHQQSRRTRGPFLRVNCGAIPSELIDSQLFGHERGSFTGATDQRKGWFERADGGTLLLDEVGDLPAAAQVRLLRVLEDGSVERVGGQQAVHVDVRVICATHRDLMAMVNANAFRADLWHRIAVFPVRIPPLRERLHDIGPLARHFAEKAATRFGLPLALPTLDDVRSLSTYAWPGNVRELSAVIDRAALLGKGERLEIATALGAGAASSPRNTDPTQHGSNGPALDSGHGVEATLDDAQRRHIAAALEACFGRVEGPFGAAARLKINPNTLRARMRKLGLDWRGFRRKA